MIVSPIVMIGRGPTFVTSACETPAHTITLPAVARNVSPVFSADQPSTCCTYSVRMKKVENITAAISSDTMFAAATARMRKIENGTSGANVRVSQTTKPARIAIATPPAIAVSTEIQPTSGAFEIAYTSSARPPVTESAPNASRRRWSRSAWLSRTIGRVSDRTRAPTGMFTKKIHSQPRYFVRMPPKRTPAAAPDPPSAPQIPSALFRSAPSGNVVVTIESAAGLMIAAPIP